jgi:hypothetical protein
MDGVCIAPAAKDYIMASFGVTNPKSVASPLLQRHNLARARRGTPVSSPVPSRLKQTLVPQPLAQQAVCRGHFSPFQLRKIQETLEEVKYAQQEKEAGVAPTESNIELVEDFESLDARFIALIEQARLGLKVHTPELCDEGVNGTYFLKSDEGRKIAVFKPQDEEGASEFNPKLNANKTAKAGSHVGSFIDGVTSSRVRKDFQVGEASYREVAAYLLDRKHHFYGVPNTCMVRISYPGWRSEKTGSFQEYVMNDGASWDIGPGLFPVKEVHKIGILDLHIFNTDRHGGNILICDADDGVYKLTPIDHGYSLPTSLDRAWFDWLTWPQSRVNFDDETKRYIEAIDPNEDAKMLRQYLPIPDEAILIMKISTMLLKHGVKFNLTLSQLGTMASRKVPEKPSVLEIMVENARAKAKVVCEQGGECSSCVVVPAGATAATATATTPAAGAIGIIGCAASSDASSIENKFLEILGEIMDEHMAAVSRDRVDPMKLW